MRAPLRVCARTCVLCRRLRMCPCRTLVGDDKERRAFETRLSQADTPQLLTSRHTPDGVQCTTPAVHVRPRPALGCTMQVRQVRGFALESLRAATADGCTPCALVVTAELNTTAEASSAHTGIRVGVRACICACMHVCVVQAHTCTHTRAHTHIHARVYAHTRASGAERGG